MSSLSTCSLDDLPRSHDVLVEVKAQVMTRDKVLGMWVPLFRGGMSLVGLYRFPDLISQGDFSQTLYVISGRRMSDNAVILNCTLSPGFQYTKVNPTFHHWAIDDSRFGLTFQTFADATAFEKTIMRVVESLKSSGTASLPLVTNGAASQKTSPKDSYLADEKDEKPCLPQKSRAKADTSALHTFAVPCSSITPTVAKDCIISVCSLDTIPGTTECSPSTLTRRSSSAEACTSSIVSAHGSPSVPYPPRRYVGAQLKSDGKPLICPRRQGPSHGQEEPLTVFAGRVYDDTTYQSQCMPERTPDSTVPPLHITPKVVVRCGIDKKRAQTPPPPLPALPLKPRVVSDALLNFDIKPKNEGQDQSLTAVSNNGSSSNTNWDEVSDDLNRKLMMVPESPIINKDSSVYFGTSYVHFMSESGHTHPEKNEYLYPNFDSTSSSCNQSPASRNAYRDYRNLGKTVTQPPIPPLPLKPLKPHHRQIKRTKESGKKCDLFRTDSANFKSKCAHCNEYFSPKDNRRGACADGPDRFRDCLKDGNCCAQAVLYHCANEDDGEGTDLWTCRTCDQRNCRQWTLLTLVCLLLPCMWCFLPLRSCHRCGVTYGCCGARHQAVLPWVPLE